MKLHLHFDFDFFFLIWSETNKMCLYYRANKKSDSYLTRLDIDTVFGLKLQKK